MGFVSTVFSLVVRALGCSRCTLCSMVFLASHSIRSLDNILSNPGWYTHRDYTDAINAKLLRFTRWFTEIYAKLLRFTRWLTVENIRNETENSTTIKISKLEVNWIHFLQALFIFSIYHSIFSEFGILPNFPCNLRQSLSKGKYGDRNIVSSLESLGDSSWHINK